MTNGIAESARFSCECCGQEYELENSDIQFEVNRSASDNGIHHIANVDELCYECGADIQIRFHAWENPKGTISKAKEDAFGVENLVTRYGTLTGKLIKKLQVN